MQAAVAHAACLAAAAVCQERAYNAYIIYIMIILLLISLVLCILVLVLVYNVIFRGVRGNHLSNATCLTHEFVKRGESCSKSW